MKKLICAILVLCMVTSLVFPVFATTTTTTTPETETPKTEETDKEEEKEEEPDEKSEFHITKIAVTGLTTPVAGAAIPQNAAEKTKVTVANEEKEELSFTTTATWKDSGTTFAIGKTYRVTFTVEFDFMDETTLIKNKTEILINEKTKATLDTKNSTGHKIVFYADFESVLGEDGITPKVELEYGEEKTKTYDGKALEIKAKITNAISGVNYEYEWYRDGKKLTDETEEKLLLLNVADSGKYSCKVYAEYEDKKESATSETVEFTIKVCVVNVEIKDADKLLNEDDPKFEYEIVGDEPYDQLIGEPVREEGEKIGTYSINQGTLEFPEEVADNYELNVTPGAFEILPAGSNKRLKVTVDTESCRISGKNDTSIRVEVIGPEGVLTEDDIVILDLPDESTVIKLESDYKKENMKGFGVKILSSDNKNIILPDDTIIRFQIPLTEEEEAYKKDTIRCVLRTSDGNAKNLPITFNEINGVTYATVEIDALGTLLLFKGEKEGKPAAGSINPTTKHKDDEEEKGGAAWLWILVTILTLAAIGAIVFTVLQARNTSAATKRYTPAKKPATPLTPEQIAARERARRIADQINAMPPVPEAKKPPQKAPAQKVMQEEGMKTRAVPAVPPKAPMSEEPKTRKISFDDLEG